MSKMVLMEAVDRGCAGLTRQQTSDIVDSIFATIGERLRDDKEFRIVGFGTFAARLAKEMQGRNPRTGEVIAIPPAWRISFRPSPSLKGTVAPKPAKAAPKAGKPAPKARKKAA